MIILNGKKEEHLNMLEGGIIAKLLEEKWTTFAKLHFIKRLAKLCIQLFCISFAIYTRPSKDESMLTGIKKDTPQIDNANITRYCFEIATLLACLEFLIVQQGEEIKNSGIRSFCRNLKGNAAKLIAVVANFLILLAVPMRFMQFYPEEEEYYRGVEESLLVFSVPGSWFYLVFFFG